MKRNPQRTNEETLQQAYDQAVQARFALPERRRFNPWLSSDDDSWMSDIYSDCFPLQGTKKHKATFGITLSNLAIATEPISICLDKRYYRSLRKKPKEFTPTNISNICNALKDNGFVSLKKGHNYRGSSAVSSTIYSTDKLLVLIPESTTFNIQREGLIVIKEFDPPEVYPDHVMEAEEVLYEYNQTVKPRDMLYATYKGGFGVDGRFHGSSIICMRKEDRRTFKMDTEETFEVDVKNCLPALLYASERGMECPGDAYDVPGVPRDLAKVAMLVLLNCVERRKAVQALQGEINRKHHGRYKANDVLMSIEHKHQKLESFFYSGIGRRLMNIESRCMCRFLGEMLDKGVKVHPIYDSVIGKVSDRAPIRDSFARSFTVNGVPPVIH